MTDSIYQENIYSAGADEDRKDHLIINAGPGSGKSTTIERFASRIRGSIFALAFNVHIAKALGERFERSGVDATTKTVHSLGRSLLTTNGLKLGGNPDGMKYNKLAKAWCEGNAGAYQSTGLDAWNASRLLSEMVDMARATLVDPSNQEALEETGAAYGVETPPLFRAGLEWVLKQGAKAAQDRGEIDFTDMIYLPNRWNLQAHRTADWLLCDEVQDFSTCQLETILRYADPNSRGLWVGDPRQSIMGFAYAAFDSWDRVRTRLNATTLPLSVCYRCPTRVLDLAREIEPSIENAPGAKEGEILGGSPQDLGTKLLPAPGSLILSRTNAPLIKICGQLLRAGIAAKVRGRDMGQQLANKIEGIMRMYRVRPDDSISALVAAIHSWASDEIRTLVERGAPDSKIARISDMAETLEAVAEACDGAAGSAAPWVRTLFADEGRGVWLSSIHRAKGLEADDVYIVNSSSLGTPFPNQTESEAAQEVNLKYVAITRAKSRLFLL